MKLELAENAANTRRAGAPAGAAMTLWPGAGGELSPPPQLLHIHVLRETQTHLALSFPLQGTPCPISTANRPLLDSGPLGTSVQIGLNAILSARPCGAQGTQASSARFHGHAGGILSF